MAEKKASKKEPVFAVLNPIGLKREVTPTTLATRISELKGKVIYCISQHIGGADLFLKRVADALSRVAPGVTAVYERRETAYMTDDPELWGLLAENANGVIYGCGA